MKIPTATYRLQFHPQFTFSDAGGIIDYLSLLGISDLYASPILKSKKDSTHGYDMVDPAQVDPQLGGKAGFDQLTAQVRGKGMGWVQDIVPNHMAFDSENRLLMDVLENGPKSKYYSFFDIQWDHPYEQLRGKVLAPFLGDIYGRCLDKNEIRLNFDEDGFNVRYYAWRLPVKIESYTQILSSDLPWMQDKINREDRQYIQFLELSNQFKELDSVTNLNERYNQLALTKAHLWKLYISHGAIKGYIDFLLGSFNGTPGDAQSLNKLDELLLNQYFKLSFWKVGNEELNYRRFFTINGLLSLHVERQEVFEYTHNLIFQLVKSGQITGLRIDHVDGLYDPVVYLNRLKQRESGLYVTVEKILDIYERLPALMPVAGTTGYDFMNMVNGVFIDRDNEKEMDKLYVDFTGQNVSYKNLLSDKKKLFMGRYMAGDIDNLAQLLKKIINGDRYGRDMTMYALRRSIVEIMAHFPVYRAYMGDRELKEEDKVPIKEAIALAKNKNAGLMNELDFIGRILLLEFDPDLPIEKKEAYYDFTKKFQQFSGALMAKGAEDTSFYIYNRFISLNEVGGNPDIFGFNLKDFHEFMESRQTRWPATMNATSTHDTKRGEDVRARLNVLSEIPKEWRQKAEQFGRINKNNKKLINGLKAPDSNDEYLIYQTLIGAWPSSTKEQTDFMGRMKEYIVKTVREAKIHTSWMKPDEDYEEACVHFIDRLLSQEDKNEFLEAFLPFQQQIASDGILNSLSQTLLKMTCPGIPDFYQGTELWDLSLVDPDNRRSVDFQVRKDALQQLQAEEPEHIKNLIENKEDGKIKMFLVSKVLEVRRQYAELFLKGQYLPLQMEGPLNRHVIAFARRLGRQWAITIVLRFARQLRSQSWKEAVLPMPAEAPLGWKNAITGAKLDLKQAIPLEKIFRDFPVVFLLAGV